MLTASGKRLNCRKFNIQKKGLDKMVSSCAGAVDVNGHDDDLTFTPTLQYWGVPEKPTRLDLRIWDTQELFLALYARCGKVVRSATMAGITPHVCTSGRRPTSLASMKGWT